jgi:hypothetical protein
MNATTAATLLLPILSCNRLELLFDTVQRNPILTGHAYNLHKTPFTPGELWVHTGMYQPSNHSFVNVLQLPADMNIPDFAKLTDSEILDYMQRDIIPLFTKCDLTAAQIKNKSPLFSVELIKLPNNYAVWSMKLSHCLGDGVTFFMLLKEISMLISGQEPPPMDWTVPCKATHELFPPTYSARDVHIAYGPPFIIGAARNVLTQPKRSVSMFLLNKHRISAEKRRIRIRQQSKGIDDEKCNVSSNDIITSALCEAAHSSDMILFTENVRGRKVSVPYNAAGNFLLEIPVPRKVAVQPDALRQVVQSLDQGYYKHNNELPMQPFVSGRVGRITSMASIATNFAYKGTKSIATLPLSSFLEDIPLDVALIFRYNQDYWGVLHNIASFHPTPLLQDAST